jgi:hypothetical protein
LGKHDLSDESVTYALREPLIEQPEWPLIRSTPVGVAPKSACRRR